MYQNTLNVITALLIEGNSKERNISLTLGLEELILLILFHIIKKSNIKINSEKNHSAFSSEESLNVKLSQYS